MMLRSKVSNLKGGEDDGLQDFDVECWNDHVCQGLVQPRFSKFFS